LKAAWGNSSRDPISKKSLHKKRPGGVAQGVGPEVKPQYCQKKKKKKKKSSDVLNLITRTRRGRYGKLIS
jgi:hypothetical protein